MARSRTISPKFFQNEKLAELPCEARLLFAGLWTIADRAGRLEDRPKRIQVQLFPYGLNGDIDQLLEALDAGDFIFRYRFNQEMFIQIPKWFTYQHPHPHEVDSIIPPIPCDLSDFKGCRDMSRASRDMSLHVMTCQAVPSVPSAPSVPSDLPRAKSARDWPAWQESAFQEFWANIWAKIGRGAARAQYRIKATTPELAEQINAAAKEQGPRLLMEAARREGGVPLHPRTWLFQERYLDERQQLLISAGRGHVPYSAPPPNPELTRTIPIEEWPETTLNGMIEFALECPGNQSAVEGAHRAKAELDRRGLCVPTVKENLTVQPKVSPFAEVAR